MNAEAYAQIGREVAALRFDLHGVVPDPNNRELHDAIDHRLYEIMQFCHSLRMPVVRRRPAKAQPPTPPDVDPPPVEAQPEAVETESEPAEPEAVTAEPTPEPEPPAPESAPPSPAIDVPRKPREYAALAPETIKMQHWRDHMKLLEATPEAYNKHIELAKTLLASLDDDNKLALLKELVEQGKTHNLGCKGWVFYQMPNTISEPHPY